MKRFFTDLHLPGIYLSTWARRYQIVLRADLKYKTKVEVSRPFLLIMAWTKDLSIDYYYCPYSTESRSYLLIGIVRASDVKDCLAIEVVYRQLILDNNMSDPC